MKRDGGMNSIEKGKRGEYLIIILKSVIYRYIIYPKFLGDGNESPSGKSKF
jgi:hypothetical protein